MRPARRRSPWTDPWSTLVGDPGRQRNRRVRITRALAELHQQGLVALGSPGAYDRYDAFELLADDGSRARYTVLGDSHTAMPIPPQLFLQGWHLVLEPREIAFWLMLRDLEWRHGWRADGVAAPDQIRRSYYGLTGAMYEAHYELAEFGLIEPRDPVPGRHRGKLTRRAHAQEAAGDEVADDRPRLETYRFAIRPEATLDRDPLAVVRAALTRDPPPRFG